MMIARCTAISAARIAGMHEHVGDEEPRLEHASSPGSAPPHSAVANGPPTRGIDIATPQAIARPIPESRSSGSE